MEREEDGNGCRKKVLGRTKGGTKRGEKRTVLRKGEGNGWKDDKGKEGEG